MAEFAGITYDDKVQEVISTDGGRTARLSYKLCPHCGMTAQLYQEKQLPPRAASPAQGIQYARGAVRGEAGAQAQHGARNGGGESACERVPH